MYIIIYIYSGIPINSCFKKRFFNLFYVLRFNYRWTGFSAYSSHTNASMLQEIYNNTNQNSSNSSWLYRFSTEFP